MHMGKDTIAVAPGTTIHEQIVITPEIANKLTKVFGIPAAFWLNMETQYRNDLKQIKN
ncbi:helix-turn-helix transcriptional regulator [Companilactobacillus suantsaicola]|uniref:helix-turn-helix transcriptional regulator n=1 Tax=Companilactobacillus suantsaicola TaxID=2487723 RepID=UPI0014369948|nr:hypothetical protein [Companilactobacillus suantsaicola]